MPLVGIHQTISDRRMTSIFQPTSTFVRQRVRGGIRCLLRNNLSEEVSFAVSHGDISNSSCSRTVELFQEFLFMRIILANDHVQTSEQGTLNSTLTDLMLSAVTLPQHQTQEGLEDRHQTCFFWPSQEAQHRNWSRIAELKQDPSWVPLEPKYKHPGIRRLFCH